MVLSDGEIADLCLLHSPPMIEPFVNYDEADQAGKVSFGLTSAGYDLRLAPEILLFKNLYVETVDPKRFADDGYRRRVFEVMYPGAYFDIPPHSYVLGRSHEYLRVPRGVKGRCVGKSTYARSGILTIEVGNITSSPARVYVMEGIAQLEFELLSREPLRSYKDKGGQYNKQTGVTPARVKM